MVILRPVSKFSDQNLNKKSSRGSTHLLQHVGKMVKKIDLGIKIKFKIRFFRLRKVISYEFCSENVLRHKITLESPFSSNCFRHGSLKDLLN
jgi:hypothetical protein